MRLDKFLSDLNFGSRKRVKKLIKAGHVKVNDEVITDSSFDFDENNEVVKYDDEVLEYLPFVYLALNKPKDYISSTIDELYPSIVNLVDPMYAKRVRIVGRLDADTTGIILLTDDGRLNNRLTHPNRSISKIYRVTLNHDIPEKLIEEFAKGVDIGKGEITRPAELKIVASNVAEVTLKEGKYHEIKRMFDRFDLDVIELDRLLFGPISYEGLEVGESRKLTHEEVEKLMELTGLDKERL